MLDDFLTVDKPDKPDICTGERTRAVLSLLFNRLKVPLAAHKCVGPTICLEYLGIILDIEEMVAKLSRNKVTRIIQFIERMSDKSRCTNHELLQLFGHLNFASRVILPGRSFVSYLIYLSASVKNLRDMVYLDVHCREDLHMWHKFPRKWNGISFFYDTYFTASTEMQLFTDSSLVGFGGIFQNQWFCSEWPPQLPSVKDDDLSMAFRELYPIVAAATIWGKSWTSERILFLSDNLSPVL